MSKIHPKTSLNQLTSEKETFTLWMKSLVFHGYGCTIFNSQGDVVFRVDNYQQKCRRNVFLMDSNGQVLFSINRSKKIRFFKYWDVYKCIDSKVNKERPWFEVRKNYRIFSRRMCCHVSIKCEKMSRSCYKIMGLEGNSAVKITDFSGQLFAEVIKKQTLGGIPLGEDVLTVMMEPKADQSLMMAFVTVYALINNKL